MIHSITTSHRTSVRICWSDECTSYRYCILFLFNFTQIFISFSSLCAQPTHLSSFYVHIPLSHTVSVDNILYFMAAGENISWRDVRLKILHKTKYAGPPKTEAKFKLKRNT